MNRIAQLSAILLTASVAISGTGCGQEEGTPPAPGKRAPADTDAAMPDQTEDDAGGLKRPATPRLPESDDEVVVPFGGEGSVTFSVAADLGRLDVHFSVDTTGSIASEIDRLQASLEAVIARRLRARVPDVAFGVSRFEDFPEAPFGSSGAGQARPDTPFALLTPITSDRRRLSQALSELDDPLGNGGDSPEAGAEALYQIATGVGITVGDDTLVVPFDADSLDAEGRFGGVGFREGALPIVVHVTDATSHAEVTAQAPHTHSLADAIDALAAINARVIGIASGACPSCPAPTDASRARAHLQRVAAGTRALTAPTGGKCPMGVDGKRLDPQNGACPLVYEVDGDGDGLPETVTEAIVELLDGVRFGVVEARASADPLRLVSAIEVTGTGGGDGTVEDRLPAGAPDGLDDTVLDIASRTELRYRVHLRNDVVAPADVDQLFRVAITVRGDGLVLSEVVVRVRVPSAAADAGAPPNTLDGGN